MSIKKIKPSCRINGLSAANWPFPQPIISTMVGAECTAGSVTRFLCRVPDRRRGRDWCRVLRTLCRRISVETADGRYTSCYCRSAWLPGTRPLTSHTTHTHTVHDTVCWYLGHELVLTDGVDPAGVSLSRSLWNPPDFTANQLKEKHLNMKALQTSSIRSPQHMKHLASSQYQRVQYTSQRTA